MDYYKVVATEFLLKGLCDRSNHLNFAIVASNLLAAHVLAYSNRLALTVQVKG